MTTETVVVSPPHGGLFNLPRNFNKRNDVRNLVLLLVLPFLLAAAPHGTSGTGGEGGWINVPGGGGGAKPMMITRGFNLENNLYFILLDPQAPSLCVASAGLVAQWASGVESLAGPETLEVKYNAKINGVVAEVVVRVDCKNMVPQECAAKLARLTYAMQKEFPPVPK